jgi:predicted site-specific integrase-resolvase
MKLAAWAREKGISYKTAWKMYKTGKIPHPTEQLPIGTILVYPDNREESRSSRKAVIYARVPSRGQKDDLLRQLQRLRDFAAIHGYTIAKEITEIGSGLKGKRKKLLKMLNDPGIGIIIVEHKDRLIRFGYEHVNTVLSSTGRKL